MNIPSSHSAANWLCDPVTLGVGTWVVDLLLLRSVQQKSIFLRLADADVCWLDPPLPPHSVKCIWGELWSMIDSILVLVVDSYWFQRDKVRAGIHFESLALLHPVTFMLQSRDVATRQTFLRGSPLAKRMWGNFQFSPVCLQQADI